MIVAPFESMPWASGNHPLEAKKTVDSLTLLKFGPGFSDPHWCERSHLFYVVEGTLTLEHAEGTLLLRRGDACILQKGERHRARNDETSSCQVLALSDFERSRSEA